MTTRLARYAADIKGALEARLVPLEGGPLDGVLMLSAGHLQEALASVPFPPPDESIAEVTTPATIYLDALCHICGESDRVVVKLESKTTVDDKHRTLAAKVDATSVTHFCGQMPLPVGGTVEGQEAFDWTIPVTSAMEDPLHLTDMLRRVGVGATGEIVDGWTEAEREAAAHWAVAAHVALSAAEVIPEAPAHVGALPAMTIDPGDHEVTLDIDGLKIEHDPTGAPDATEVCPFPGCTRAPEHRGGHKGADGKTIKPPPIPEPDAEAGPVMTDDPDDVLPE